MNNWLRLIGASALGLTLIATSGAASARDIQLGRYTLGEIKAFCSDMRNVQYLESQGIYGCSWIGDSGMSALLCSNHGCVYTSAAHRQVVKRRSALRDIARGRL